MSAVHHGASIPQQDLDTVPEPPINVSLPFCVTPPQIGRVQTEQSILACVDHPFLATLYCTLETPSHLHFILQICEGGELYGLLNAQPKKRLREVTSLRLTAAESSLHPVKILRVSRLRRPLAIICMIRLP